jgi:hypothetical protein
VTLGEYLSENVTTLVFLCSIPLFGIQNFIDPSETKVYLNQFEFPKDEQYAIKVRAWKIIKMWEYDFERESRNVTIEVVREPWFEGGRWLDGVYRPHENKIVVNASLNVLYHELCHLNVDSSSDHRDPRWPKWHTRSKQLALSVGEATW